MSCSLPGRTCASRPKPTPPRPCQAPTGNSETLLEYCPDYAAERASGVVRDCARLGIELPTVELLELMPEWSAMLY